MVLPSGFRVLALSLSACVATGCVGLQVNQLTPDLQVKETGKDTGVIYYLPLPYLMVVELPPTAKASMGSDGNQNAPERNPHQGNEVAPPGPEQAPPGVHTGSAPGGPVRSGSGHTTTPTTSPRTTNPSNTGTPGAQTPKGGDKNGTTTADGSGSPGPVSDTSFSASTPQYVLKLIYLPDLSRPIALRTTAGLGTTSLKPTLQDGWMLTSLDAATDTKTPETLTALGGIVGSVLGKGSPAATASGGSKPGGAETTTAPETLPDLSGYYRIDHSILKPGLYRFQYDDKGVLIALVPVSFFTGCGTVNLMEPAVLQGAIQAACASLTPH